MASKYLKKAKKAVKSVVSATPIGEELWDYGSKVGAELERGAAKLETEAQKAARSGYLGLIPAYGQMMRDVQKAEEKAARKQEEMLLKQQRSALLEQAKLQNDIAMRQRIAKYGGRRSLLMSGETGFSGSLLQ